MCEAWLNFRRVYVCYEAFLHGVACSIAHGNSRRVCERSYAGETCAIGWPNYRRICACYAAFLYGYRVTNYRRVCACCPAFLYGWSVRYQVAKFLRVCACCPAFLYGWSVRYQVAKFLSRLCLLSSVLIWAKRPLSGGEIPVAFVLVVQPSYTGKACAVRWPNSCRVCACCSAFLYEWSVRFQIAKFPSRLLRVVIICNSSKAARTACVKSECKKTKTAQTNYSQCSQGIFLTEKESNNLLEPLIRNLIIY